MAEVQTRWYHLGDIFGPVRVASGLPDDLGVEAPTAAAGELSALAWVIYGLAQMTLEDVRVPPADVNSDSEWAIGAITGGWALSRHLALLRDVRALWKQIAVFTTLTHVRAHVGIIQNERADALAALGRIGISWPVARQWR